MAFIIKYIKGPDSKSTAMPVSGTPSQPPPEEAANLRLRSELMDKITALIQKNHWTQLEAAKHCSVSLLARCAGQRCRAPWPASACGA